MLASVGVSAVRGVPVDLARGDHHNRDHKEQQQRAQQQRVIFRHQQPIDGTVQRGQDASEREAIGAAAQYKHQVVGQQPNARDARQQVRRAEADVL